MEVHKTVIAIAIAGTAVTPIIAQAGAGEIYASARVGIWNVDTDGVSNLELRSFASRLGMEGETDLGNGLTGFGHYEFDVDLDDDGSFGIRHRYVGLQGDWGRVWLGKDYHTWYNFVVGPLDVPWWHSGFAMVEFRSRTDNAISYASDAGAVKFGFTTYFVRDDEEEAPDLFEAGASFGLGDSTLAFAYSNVADGGTQGSADNDDDIFGVAWTGIGIGDTSLGVSYMTQDDDDGIVIDWVIGNAYFHSEMLSRDATDQDIVMVNLGYTQTLGRKTLMYYELVNIDYDAASDDDYTAIMAVLKYDII